MPRDLRPDFEAKGQKPGTAILLSFLTFVLFAAAGDYEAMKKELWLYVASASTGILIWMPLGIVMFGVLSLPAVVAARVGAFFGNRRTRRSEL